MFQTLAVYNENKTKQNKQTNKVKYLKKEREKKKPVAGMWLCTRKDSVCVSWLTKHRIEN